MDLWTGEIFTLTRAHLYVCVCLSLTYIVTNGSSAFCEEDNSPRLDHFFCLFFQQLIQPSRLIDSPTSTTPDVSGTLFLDSLPAVRWLTLPPEIKASVESLELKGLVCFFLHLNISENKATRVDFRLIFVLSVVGGSGHGAVRL